MTVSNSTYRVSYNGNGSTTSFSIPFYFISNSDILVSKLDTNVTPNVETTLILGTDYNLSGAGDLSGGTLTTIGTLASGEDITIERSAQYTQSTDYEPFGRFPAETLEQNIDKLTMLAQQVKSITDRSPTFKKTTSFLNREIAEPESGEFLKWDANGNIINGGSTVENNGLYTYPDNNAVQETINQRLAQYLNVKDFGATGDGVTDDQPFIQNAIDAAGFGDIIYFPAGSYLLKNPLTLKIGTVLKGVEGGVSAGLGAFTEGSALFLSQTLPDGSTWTTTEVNSNGDTYSGRIMFIADEAGGSLCINNLLCYSDGATANNSTWLYCGGPVDTAPYQNGRVTQFHSSHMRLFTFAIAVYGGSFADAWLQDFHTEQCSAIFVPAATIGNNVWTVHMANCLFYQTLQFWADGNNIDCVIVGTNVDITGTGATDNIFASAQTGTGEHYFQFSNSRFIDGRFNLRDISSVGGNVQYQFSNCYFENGGFLLVEEGAARVDSAQFSNCTFLNYPTNWNTYGKNLGHHNCSYQGSTTKISLKGGGPLELCHGNWQECTTSAPLIDMQSGVLHNDMLIAYNIFKSASDIGGAGYPQATSERFLVIGNRTVADVEYNNGGQDRWTPASIFNVWGTSISGAQIQNASIYLKQNNSSGSTTDVRLNATQVSDAHSKLAIQTAISTTVGDKVVIDESGNLLPGVNNTYSFGDGSTRWTEIFATNGTINSSDERLKKDVEDSELGLSFIEKLKPRKYRWVTAQFKPVIHEKYNGEQVYDSFGNPCEYETPIPEHEAPERYKCKDLYTKVDGERFHYGLLAQELKEALPEGLDFAGWTLKDKNDPDSEQGVRYMELIAPLIKAIQELSQKVKLLEDSMNQ